MASAEKLTPCIAGPPGRVGTLGPWMRCGDGCGRAGWGGARVERRVGEAAELVEDGLVTEDGEERRAGEEEDGDG